MIVTEKEARTKDCPTQGRDKCTASECMGWRFHKRESGHSIGGGPGGLPPKIKYEITNKGYCKIRG